MYPDTQISVYALFRVIDVSYWPIYGQVDILEKIYECLEASDCETYLDYYITFVFLMVYMIISSVLLLNLLIAMFR